MTNRAATPTDVPHTVGAWRAAVVSGADLPAMLAAVRETTLAHSADPAWIRVATASEWAAQLDVLGARLASGKDRAELLGRYPLLGVPFAVKDNIDIAGVPTTAACPAFAFTPQRHATVVQRLLDAGAVWVGKTNLDQFATGLVGTRSPYGRPASAFDAARISGGSSSGSAVAVASGWALFALGTDTAGSGRVPAGLNNLVGLKPSVGRVSTAGVLPACRTLDCVSVFALTVEDAAAVLAVMEGADEADAYSTTVSGPARLPRRPRIGVPTSTPWFGDAGYEAAWQQAVEQAGEHAEIVPLDFQPLWNVAALLYSGAWVAERHATVQRLMETQPEAMDPVVREVIGRALSFSATDAFRDQYRLRELASQAQAIWRQVDMLFVPTAPGHPRFEEIDADPIGVNSLMGTWTNFVNLLGWCALAVPAGFTARGLPFGVTLIAAGGADVALAHWAAQWQASRALVMGGPSIALAPGAVAAAPLPAPRTMRHLPIAVVGAHLSGLPLNSQLTERGAWLREATQTAPTYRLYALPGTVPPKPGMQRVADGGGAIALEVWEMPIEQVGSFLALIPPPLGLGSVELADGRHVHGFVCEAHALQGATDITHHGGWRAYLASLKAAASNPSS